MKTGFIFAQTKYNTLDDDDDDISENDKEESSTYGAYTSFSYRFKRYEFGLDSRITLGKARDLDFSYNNNSVRGSGRIRLVDITPYLRINSNSFKLPKPTQDYISDINNNPWIVYFKIGPSWIIQTLALDNFQVSGDLSQDYKITYESFGFSIGLGVEEQTVFKETRPVFFEVSVSAYQSYKVSLVDKSDSTAINILSERNSEQAIKTFQLIFIVGMTLF